ncbi:hypothetical protein FH972_026069 [Carpinus fangiana]|uniref:Uncharacterized protein n=1 Tax=Carpinus fangiana TaxID=176857 RepID=A0A5N6L330_9ROSI|nr:hypothetical protein FH972_026069 [Carpinus fangiana]
MAPMRPPAALKGRLRSPAAGTPKMWILARRESRWHTLLLVDLLDDIEVDGEDDDV